MMTMFADDDDDWTQVTTTESDRVECSAATAPQSVQDGRPSVTPCQQVSAEDACDAGVSGDASECVDTERASVEHVAEVSPAVVSSPAATSSVTEPASTDHQCPAVVTSLTSTDHGVDHTDVAAMPERTSPSDESSNTKGWLDSLQVFLRFRFFSRSLSLTFSCARLATWLSGWDVGLRLADFP